MAHVIWVQFIVIFNNSKYLIFSLIVIGKNSQIPQEPPDLTHPKSAIINKNEFPWWIEACLKRF